MSFAHWVAAAALVFSACAAPRVSMSPRYEFSKVRRVAVSSFEGQGGQAAADFLAHALLGAGLDVVERGRLEAVLAERDLSRAGALDPATALSVGRLLGVDAIFVGSVTRYSPARNYFVLASTTALGGAAELGSSSRVTQLPAFGGAGSVVTSDASVGLAARLVDVETGSVVWSAHQSYEGFDIDSALSAVAESFAEALTPLLAR